MQFSGGGPTTAREGAIERDDVLAQVDRIVQSHPFRESHQIQRFLQFVVEETLEGREDGLKEYLIGCKVFRRRPEYDPRHDAIVRVQATQLRKKLETYYEHEGAADPVIVALPRGHYVPAIRRREVPPEPPIATAPPEIVPAPVRVAARKPLVAAFLAGLTVALAVWLVWAHSRTGPTPFRTAVAEPSDFPELWQGFCNPRSTTLVTFGVPLFYGAGGMYLRDTRVNAQGQESLGRITAWGDFLGMTPQPNDDLYTGIGEAVGVHRVSSFLAEHGAPVQVSSARSFGASELGGRNLVVLASLRFLTVLSDLNLPADFVFHGGPPERVENLRPGGQERRQYDSVAGASGITTSYALASLWPGTTPGTRILHIGGVHTWSTQAATEFLLKPASLRRLRTEFRRDRVTKAHGRPAPFFQILLRVEGRGNQFQNVEYVTHHYLPADAHPNRP